MSNDICIRVGVRIRTLRRKRGWTQDYLGQVSGIGRCHISDLEIGRREPCMRVIDCLATSLKVNLATFFEGV